MSYLNKVTLDFISTVKNIGHRVHIPLKAMESEDRIKVAVTLANNLQSKKHVRELKDTLSRRVIDGQVFLQFVAVAEEPGIEGRELIGLGEICHDSERVRNNVFKVDVREFLSACSEGCDS